MIARLPILLITAIACLSSSGAAPKTADLFVSTRGNDKEPGIRQRPKATIQGALDMLREFRDKGIISPQVPVNIWLRGGIYRPEKAVLLSSDEVGSESAPLRISAYKNEEVIFDHGLPIPTSAFTPSESDRLHPEATGKILEAKITDKKIARTLAGPDSQISLGGRMLTLARFPNYGLAIFDQIISSDTPEAPGTREKPVGAKVKLTPASSQDWSKELSKSPDAEIVGYLSSDWLKETHPIVTTGNENAFQLASGAKYGITPGRKIGRAFVQNLLCELDSPGEWFYARETSTLYFWPPTALTEDEPISVWSSGSAFVFNESSHVKVDNITFQNFYDPKNGSAIIQIKSGHHNEIRGCTFRNIAGPSTAFNIEGTSNGVRSCDIYDVNSASRLKGGRVRNDSIIPGKNFIENCHFTQIFSKSFSGKVCGISGAGNIFRNNLAHNHNIQIVTIRGNDHLIERNEIFNTGIEEGDGGAFYQGASASSWGNTFRHNFFHHIICLPKIYPRAAIFSDDGDLGDTVVSNIFYKAGEGFKINEGGGHYATNNVSIDGIHALQVLQGNSASRYKDLMNFIKTDPTTDVKANTLGRGFSTFGVTGWRDKITPENWPEMVSPYWYERYPRMKDLFTTWFSNKSIAPVNTFEDNTFYAYERTPIDAPDTTIDKGNKTKSGISGFVSAKSLNFASNSHDIPFSNIGIYADTFRDMIPEKDSYRKIVAKHWKDTKSAARGSFDPKAVNKRIYFNTGLVIRRLVKPDFAKNLQLSP